MDFLTGIGTTTIHLGATSFTLNEQQVAGLVGAVDMGVTRGVALMAVGDDISGDALAASVVENEIFP